MSDDALERWRILVHEVNGKTFFGQRGIRDPQFPCDAFEPGDPEVDKDGCQTDGHYMCDECVNRATCEDCGKRPMYCECPRDDEFYLPGGYGGGARYRW